MKFVKERWFPLTVSISLAFLIGVLMFLCGFRITYAPELENNWDAISAVAAWVGVLASFTAVWFAIKVPKEIANRQDRIALFEKRLACFEMLETQREIYLLIKDETDIEKIKHNIVLVYSPDYSGDFNAINFPLLIDKLINQCTQMSFLFDGIEYKEANNIGITFGKFIAALYSAEDERIMSSKADYLEAIDNFVSKHIEEMSRYLFVRKS